MVTIQVCVGSACHLKGSYHVIDALQELIGEYHVEDNVCVRAVFCLGHCTTAVSVKLEQEEQVFSVDSEHVREFFQKEILPRIS